MIVPKKNQLIGIDIGSYSIKIVEIEHKKKEKVLKNIGIAYLPLLAVSPSGIRDSEAVKTAISNLFQNLKIKNKKVAIGLSASSIITKKISLVESEELNLEEVIKEEAERFIPFDMDEIYLDYDIMDTIYEENEEIARLEIIVVASKKDLVESYVKILKEINLAPSIVDVDILAMQNVFELSNPNIDIEKIYLLVDIGASTINTNAVKGNISLFIRSSQTGGISITKRIMKEFQIGFEEAEKIKFGIIELEGDQKKKVRNIFRETVEEWVNEIRGNIQFIHNSYPGEEIEKIFITGGSTNILNLEKFFEKELELPVERLDPFSGLTIDKNIDPSYLDFIKAQSTIAVGLGLRKIADK